MTSLSREQFEELVLREKTGELTEEERQALEPYRVKRAVIIAAGFGSRMVPITLNTPKPLVRVHGKRIIEGILDALVQAGIEEIYLVRGYLGEQFDQLLYKYPMIRFVENPGYNEANNISSTLLTKDLLCNAYVCEADLVLHNGDLIQKYHYTSNFLGIPVEESDDWCFVTEEGIIRQQLTSGGSTENLKEGQKLYQEVGISYWSKEDGAKLAEHIPSVYTQEKGPQTYWDQVPLQHYISEYRVEIRPCQWEDIVEIDTFAELKKIDSAYDV